MSLFNELKRRNVIRVAAAYLIIGWLLAQVSATLESALHMPEWFDTMVVTVMLIGFPIALIIAWVYELTPDGIKKEKDVESDNSITRKTGKKLDYITIVAAIAVAGMFAWQQMRDKDTVQNKTPVIPAKETISTNNTEPYSQLAENKSVVNKKSIAVLPFANLANNPKSEAITVGLHDDLLTHISKISALKVISRTSVLQFKDTTKDIKQIAQELGVANILEGGVQQSGNQIRINVQLIDAQTDENIWSEKYDRELTINNIFKIQSEISEKIATALKAQLTPEEKQNLAHQGTDNLEAYNAYLAARQLQVNRNSKELKQALKLFQKATELDPNYALAYIGQADTLSFLREYSDLPLQDMFILGEPLIAKALKLNPLLAEAYASKANYQNTKTEYKDAEENFKHSLILNPNNATSYHWYGLMLRNDLGRFDEALTLHLKAAELDPMSPNIQVNVGFSLLSAGRTADALERFKLVVKLAPKFSEGMRGMASAYRAQVKFDKAIIWLNKAKEIDLGNSTTSYLLGTVYLNLADSDKAHRILAKMQKQFPDNPLVKLLQRNIYLAESQLTQQWFDEFKKEYQSNLDYLYDQLDLAHMNIVLAHYQAASELLSESLSRDKDGSIIVNTRNIYHVLDYIWCLNQINKQQEAEPILQKAQQIIKNMPNQSIGWLRVNLNAVQGKYHAAAVAYADVIEKSSYDNWWIIQDGFYYKELIKQPEYIQAQKKLMGILKKQRENLAKLETENINN